MKTITNIIYPACALLAFGCFPFVTNVRAVTPAPDGGYPNGNTAEGSQALFSLSVGPNNTATGAQTLYSNTTGTGNTATGYRSLFHNVEGGESTATGSQALFYNNDCCNTATGARAMFYNTDGAMNTATGWQALYRNTTGTFNTADGLETLRSNSRGSSNTAIGFQALYSNTTGNFNTANAYNALYSNTTGSSNTAVGDDTLYFHTTGDFNVALGTGALGANRTGRGNIGIGYEAGRNLFSGNDNIYIGTSGGASNESSTIRIGLFQTQTYIAGISGVAVGGLPVVVNNNGALGITGSSARFKDEIKPMDKVSEAILTLKPVTFRYKKEIDAECTPQFGLVAEDVEKVNPDLVARDRDGKPYSVRYEAVNAMLLNEFLKEHRTVQEQGRELQKQAATIDRLEQQIQALTSGLQKVNAHGETNNSAPQVAENNY